MDQTMRHIEDEIHRERQDLSRNLDELQEHARAMTDWHTHYRKHMLAALGVAAGAGFVAGAMTAGRRRVSREHPRRSFVSATSSALARLDRNRYTSSRVNDTWDSILDALLGLASSATVAFVAKHIPGFEEHYQPARDPMRQSPSSVPSA